MTSNIPDVVKQFIVANDLNRWTVYPRANHWFAFDWVNGKEYFLA